VFAAAEQGMATSPRREAGPAHGREHAELSPQLPMIWRIYTRRASSNCKTRRLASSVLGSALALLQVWASSPSCPRSVVAIISCGQRARLKDCWLATGHSPHGRCAGHLQGHSGRPTRSGRACRERTGRGSRSARHDFLFEIAARGCDRSDPQAVASTIEQDWRDCAGDEASTRTIACPDRYS